MTRLLCDSLWECIATRFGSKPTLTRKFTQNRKCSPLNKELPPKPVLRRAESPEQRSIFGEFAAFSSPDTAVETTVNVRKVSATTIAVQSKQSGLPREGQPVSSVMATEPNQTSVSDPAQRHLPTTGQITALRNDSLLARHAPKSRFNHTNGLDTSPYGTQKRIQRPKVEVKREVKVMDDVSDAGSSPSFGSPQQFDDLQRRSLKYGLGGPTIGFSNNAHQILMGNQAW
jgi:hypothetical protein